MTVDVGRPGVRRAAWYAPGVVIVDDDDVLQAGPPHTCRCRPVGAGGGGGYLPHGGDDRYLPALFW